MLQRAVQAIAEVAEAGQDVFLSIETPIQRRDHDLQPRLHLLHGADAFRRGYLPVCRSIARDNQVGKVAFLATRVARRFRLPWEFIATGNPL